MTNRHPETVLKPALIVAALLSQAQDEEHCGDNHQESKHPTERYAVFPDLCEHTGL